LRAAGDYSKQPKASLSRRDVALDRDGAGTEPGFRHVVGELHAEKVIHVWTKCFLNAESRIGAAQAAEQLFRAAAGVSSCEKLQIWNPRAPSANSALEPSRRKR